MDTLKKIPLVSHNSLSYIIPKYITINAFSKKANRWLMQIAAQYTKCSPIVSLTWKPKDIKWNANVPQSYASHKINTIRHFTKFIVLMWFYIKKTLNGNINKKWTGNQSSEIFWPF